MLLAMVVSIVPMLFLGSTLAVVSPAQPIKQDIGHLLIQWLIIPIISLIYLVIPPIQPALLALR